MTKLFNSYSPQFPFKTFVVFPRGNPVHQHGNPVHQHGNPQHQHGNPQHQHGNPVHQHGNPVHQHGNPVEIQCINMEIQWKSWAPTWKSSASTWKSWAPTWKSSASTWKSWAPTRKSSASTYLTAMLKKHLIRTTKAVSSPPFHCFHCSCVPFTCHLNNGIYANISHTGFFCAFILSSSSSFFFFSPHFLLFSQPFVNFNHNQPIIFSHSLNMTAHTSNVFKKTDRYSPWMFCAFLKPCASWEFWSQLQVRAILYISLLLPTDKNHKNIPVVTDLFEKWKPIFLKSKKLHKRRDMLHKVTLLFVHKQGLGRWIGGFGRGVNKWVIGL